MGSMDSGLWMFQGEGFSFEDAGGRIPRASVRAVIRDGSGSLCVGTWGLGLYRYSERGFEHFTTRQGLPSDFIHALCPARAGGTWIATNLGMAKLQGTTVTFLPSEPFGVSFAQIIRDIWEDPEGILWAVSLERGLLRWDGRRLEAFPAVYPKDFVYSRTLHRDGRGRLWLGTLGGLYELAGAELRAHRIREVPSSDFVIQIAEDRLSRLWLLTPHKILVSPSPAGETPGPWTEVPLGPAGAHGTLASLAFDEAGDAWVGGTGRLFRIRWSASGSAPAVQDYGISEGFPPEACQERAALADPSGDLYLGTSRGLLRFRPEGLDPERRKPLVYLTGVRLFFRETNWNAGPQGLSHARVPPGGTALAPGQDHLTFDYTGLVFPGSRQLLFQHRLDGVDTDWAPPSPSTSATYPDLRPGTYTFRVRAGLPSRDWTEAAPLTFSIRKPFVRTAWFYLICLASLALAVVAVVHARTRMLLQRRQELERLVSERTAQLADARSGLELTVASRTADLVSAREALQSQLEETQSAQRALAESLRRFRSLYENALVGIFRADLEGRLLLANPAFMALFGASRIEELKGVNLCCGRCISSPPEGACSHRLRETESPGVFEVGCTRLDGEPVLARIHAKVVPAAGGEGSYVEGAVEDITAIRKAQYRLDFLEKALEAMDVGLTITDSAHRILYANASEARMHGMVMEELVGMDARHLAPESLRHQMDWQPAEGRKVYRREGLNRRKDGSLFPVHLTSIPIAGKRGIPLGLITACEDLTESKQKEVRLQEALRDAVVGKLAAMVAHQVNTPLAAMKTRLELLRDDVPDSPEAQAGIEVLMKQVDKVAQTIRALLGFVRQRSFAESPVCLQDVIASVVRLFDTVFRSKGIEVTLSLPSQNLMVQGNTSDLQEVFLNLLENQREALGAGSRVWVSARCSEGVVEVSVEDDGPGLGPDPERVFEPFYTTKVTGTGLGLPICRNICAACGGTIRAENRPPAEGGGARFVVTLPLAGGPLQKESGA
jgi:PAS domain S-box-containing protein